MSAMSPQPTSSGKSRFSMYWTYERELMLIKYFEEHRYLWDTDHILFHKRATRLQSFAELVDLLGIDEATIRQRWSSMRSQFCREQRKVTLCPTYTPTWDHYNALRFLRKSNEDLEENNLHVHPTAYDITDGQPVEILKHEYDDGSGNNGTMSAEELARSYLEADESNADAPTHLSSPTNPVRSATRRRFARQKKRILLQSRQAKRDGIKSALPPPPAAPTTPEVAQCQKAENECFSQYICSVLSRFPADKQRRCRNELLRIILKYDIGDNDGDRRMEH